MVWNRLARQDSPEPGPGAQMRISSEDASQLVQQVFGQQPDSVAWPGGRSRKTFVITYGDQKYVVSRRAGPGRARLEAHILERLHAGGFSPKLVRQRENWVVQSFVPGDRLAVALATGGGNAGPAAARSLALMQQAATTANLHEIVPAIGARPGWTRDLLTAGHRIAAAQGWPAPDLDLDQIETFLTSPPRTFVKWDARPGNAVVNPATSQPVWIDWEHAGLRVAADDLVWLVCDEWFPEDPELEAATIAAYQGGHGDAFDFDLDRYVRVFGVFHMLVRATLILERLRSAGWGDETRLLQLDQVGATPGRLASLCARGRRWSALSPEAGSLAGLFDRIASLCTPAKPDDQA